MSQQQNPKASSREDSKEQQPVTTSSPATTIINTTDSANTVTPATSAVNPRPSPPILVRNSAGLTLQQEIRDESVRLFNGYVAEMIALEDRRRELLPLVQQQILAREDVRTRDRIDRQLREMYDSLAEAKAIREDRHGLQYFQNKMQRIKGELTAKLLAAGQDIGQQLQWQEAKKPMTPVEHEVLRGLLAIPNKNKRQQDDIHVYETRIAVDAKRQERAQARARAWAQEHAREAQEQEVIMADIVATNHVSRSCPSTGYFQKMQQQQQQASTNPSTVGGGADTEMQSEGADTMGNNVQHANASTMNNLQAPATSFSVLQQSVKESSQATAQFNRGSNGEDHDMQDQESARPQVDSAMANIAEEESCPDQPMDGLQEEQDRGLKIWHELRKISKVMAAHTGIMCKPGCTPAELSCATVFFQKMLDRRIKLVTLLPKSFKAPAAADDIDFQDDTYQGVSSQSQDQEEGKQDGAPEQPQPQPQQQQVWVPTTSQHRNSIAQLITDADKADVAKLDDPRAPEELAYWGYVEATYQPLFRGQQEKHLEDQKKLFDRCADQALVQVADETGDAAMAPHHFDDPLAAYLQENGVPLASIAAEDVNWWRHCHRMAGHGLPSQCAFNDSGPCVSKHMRTIGDVLRYLENTHSLRSDDNHPAEQGYTSENESLSPQEMAAIDLDRAEYKVSRNQASAALKSSSKDLWTCAQRTFRDTAVIGGPAVPSRDPNHPNTGQAIWTFMHYNMDACLAAALTQSMDDPSEQYLQTRKVITFWRGCLGSLNRDELPGELHSIFHDPKQLHRVDMLRDLVYDGEHVDSLMKKAGELFNRLSAPEIDQACRLLIHPDEADLMLRCAFFHNEPFLRQEEATEELYMGQLKDWANLMTSIKFDWAQSLLATSLQEDDPNWHSRAARAIIVDPVNANHAKLPLDMFLVQQVEVWSVAKKTKPLTIDHMLYLCVEITKVDGVQYAEEVMALIIDAPTTSHGIMVFLSMVSLTNQPACRTLVNQALFHSDEHVVLQQYLYGTGWSLRNNKLVRPNGSNSWTQPWQLSTSTQHDEGLWLVNELDHPLVTHMYSPAIRAHGARFAAILGQNDDSFPAVHQAAARGSMLCMDFPHRKSHGDIVVVLQSVIDAIQGSLEWENTKSLASNPTNGKSYGVRARASAFLFSNPTTRPYIAAFEQNSVRPIYKGLATSQTDRKLSAGLTFRQEARTPKVNQYLQMAAPVGAKGDCSGSPKLAMCINLLISSRYFRTLFDLIYQSKGAERMSTADMISGYLMDGGTTWKSLAFGMRFPYLDANMQMHGLNIVPSVSFDCAMLRTMRDPLFFNATLGLHTRCDNLLVRIDKVCYFDKQGHFVPYTCQQIYAVKRMHRGPQRDLSVMNGDHYGRPNQEYMISDGSTDFISTFTRPGSAYLGKILAHADNCQVFVLTNYDKVATTQYMRDVNFEKGFSIGKTNMAKIWAPDGTRLDDEGTQQAIAAANKVKPSNTGQLNFAEDQLVPKKALLGRGADKNWNAGRLLKCLQRRPWGMDIDAHVIRQLSTGHYCLDDYDMAYAKRRTEDDKRLKTEPLGLVSTQPKTPKHSMRHVGELLRRVQQGLADIRAFTNTAPAPIPTEPVAHPFSRVVYSDARAVHPRAPHGLSEDQVRAQRSRLGNLNLCAVESILEQVELNQERLSGATEAIRAGLDQVQEIESALQSQLAEETARMELRATQGEQLDQRRGDIQDLLATSQAEWVETQGRRLMEQYRDPTVRILPYPKQTYRACNPTDDTWEVEVRGDDRSDEGEDWYDPDVAGWANEQEDFDPHTTVLSEGNDYDLCLGTGPRVPEDEIRERVKRQDPHPPAPVRNIQLIDTSQTTKQKKEEAKTRRENDVLHDWAQRDLEAKERLKNSKEAIADNEFLMEALDAYLAGEMEDEGVADQQADVAPQNAVPSPVPLTGRRQQRRAPQNPVQQQQMQQPQLPPQSVLARKRQRPNEHSVSPSAPARGHDIQQSNQQTMQDPRRSSSQANGSNLGANGAPPMGNPGPRPAQASSRQSEVDESVGMSRHADTKIVFLNDAQITEFIARLKIREQRLRTRFGDKYPQLQHRIADIDMERITEEEEKQAVTPDVETPYQLRDRIVRTEALHKALQNLTSHTQAETQQLWSEYFAKAANNLSQDSSPRQPPLMARSARLSQERQRNEAMQVPSTQVQEPFQQKEEEPSNRPPQNSFQRMLQPQFSPTDRSQMLSYVAPERVLGAPSVTQHLVQLPSQGPGDQMYDAAGNPLKSPTPPHHAPIATATPQPHSQQQAQFGAVQQLGTPRAGDEQTSLVHSSDLLRMDGTGTDDASLHEDGKGEKPDHKGASMQSDAADANQKDLEDKNRGNGGTPGQE